MDLISSLPGNLIATILMKLPFRDAARTCTLSTRWKYRWVKLPHLELDATFWKESLQNEIKGRVAKFEAILFRILLLHQGPVSNIHLHVPELESPPELDTLITFIVRNGVETCFIDSFPGRRNELHSSLFTSPTLIDLNLWFCEVKFIPSTFEGFINLTRFALVNVTISAQALGILVSSCPSLKYLNLIISIDISCLKINAPKLVHFLYSYSNSSQTSLPVNYSQQQQAIFKLLGGFPDLKSLCMHKHSLKCLAAGGFPTRLPTVMLHRLELIHLLHICLEDVDIFSAVLCLMRSSPNLQKLKLFPNHSLVENTQCSSVLFAKSPSLRKMTISFATSKIADKGLKIIKEMFMFQRAAPNVDVHIKD